MKKTFPFFWVLVSWLGLSAQDVSVEGERHLGFGELRLWEGFGHPREKGILPSEKDLPHRRGA